MLSFIDVIPSRECISRGEPLNVLGGVANGGEALSVDISLWGRATGDWEPLVTRRFELRAGEHRHLYFTLDPSCFSREGWGEAPGELELRISDRRPKAGELGRLVFVE